MSEENVAGTASAGRLRQVVALTRWVGAGRKLAQRGQLTMADARHLVGLLETGDEIGFAGADRRLDAVVLAASRTN